MSSLFLKMTEHDQEHAAAERSSVKLRQQQETSERNEHLSTEMENKKSEFHLDAGRSLSQEQIDVCFWVVGWIACVEEKK